LLASRFQGFNKNLHISVELGDVAFDRMDVDIQVRKLGTNHACGRVGVQMTFPDDNLQQENTQEPLLDLVLIFPNKDLLLSFGGKAVHQALIQCPILLGKLTLLFDIGLHVSSKVLQRHPAVLVQQGLEFCGAVGVVFRHHENIRVNILVVPASLITVYLEFFKKLVEFVWGTTVKFFLKRFCHTPVPIVSALGGVVENSLLRLFWR